MLRTFANSLSSLWKEDEHQESQGGVRNILSAFADRNQRIFLHKRLEVKNILKNIFDKLLKV